MASEIRDSQSVRLVVAVVNKNINDSQVVRLTTVEQTVNFNVDQIVRLTVAEFIPPVDDLCGSTDEPLTFCSVRVPGEDNPKWYSVVDLPDDDTYYGGWKEDRLLNVSEIRRSLSGPNSDYQIGTFQIELADDDYAIRSQISSAAGRFYSKWEVEAYLVTPAGRKLQYDATKIATGLVDSDPTYDNQTAGMSVQLSCRDRVGISMGWTNVGQSKLPRRVISNTTLPGVVPAMVGKGAPIPWGRLSSEIVVPEGFVPPIPSGISARGAFIDQFGPPTYWVGGYAPWNQTVPAVTGLALSAGAGGDCPERQFAVQVFPVDASNNVGDPSPFVPGDTTVTLSAGNQTVHVSWSGIAAKYYVVLYANWFGWRAQQIIETTGLSCDFDHAFDTPDPGTGYATGAVRVPAAPFYYYSARSKISSIVSDWHEVAFPTEWPEQFARSITLPNGKTRPSRLYWVPVVSGADTYQVKKRGAGGAPIIFDMLPSSLEDGLLYWDDDYNDSDALVAGADDERAAGRLKGFYTRDVDLPDGNTWREIMLAGVPIKDVSSWYYDPGGDPENIEVNQGNGTDFLIPKAGTTEWPSVLGAARYRDIVGTDGVTRRYMMAYAKGVKGDLIASGTSVITFDVEGVEANGDCEGDLIEDLHDQTVHELNQFVVASGEGYTSGDWLPAPTQSEDDSLIVDVDSFTALKEMRQAEVPGGLVAAGVTGFNGELIDVSEWLKRRCMSGDFRMGPSLTWQIKAAAINQNLSPLFIDTELSDVYDIHTRTFKPTPRLTELQNVFEYRHKRDSATGNWLVDNQTYRNEESIANWGIVKQGEDLSFHYIEDAAVVDLIRSRHVSRRSNAPMYVVGEFGLCQLSSTFDIGEYFKLTHWRGVGSQGWSNRLMWIISHTFIPSTKRVRLECLDVTDLLGTSRTYAILEALMDIDLGGSWYNSPSLSTSGTQTVDAYEYRDRQFPWSDFPDGTTLTARVYGAVPSGVSMTLQIYDPDADSVVATDPTAYTSSSFVLHTFQLPSSTTDKQYRLRAVVTGGSGNQVQFLGALRPDLP